MTTTINASPWDFSHILDFNKNFSSSTAPEPPPTDNHEPTKNLKLGTTPEKHEQKQHGNVLKSIANGVAATTYTGGLGDLSAVWEFLGTSNLPNQKESDIERFRHVTSAKLDYASDGAAQKGIRDAQSVFNWSDGTDGEEPIGGASDQPLTKTQKKRARRKERKVLQGLLAHREGLMSESEADSPARKTPARKASTHVGQSTPAKQTSLLGQSAIQDTLNLKKAPIASPTTLPGVDPKGLKAVLDKTIAAHTTTSQAKTSVYHQVNSAGSISSDEAVKRVAEAKAQIANLDPVTPTPASRHKLQTAAAATTQASSAHLASSKQTTQQVTQPKSVATPQSKVATQFFPASVPPKPTVKPTIGSASPRPASPPKSGNKKTKRASTIEPKIVRSGEDRNWALLLKIINTFGADRKYLVSPANMTTHNNDPKGIHIFVDASNIFIGFMDMLKRTRGFPQHYHFDKVHYPSFDGLALLMERRRPVAKRWLVGSTPHVPAFDQADSVGYKCHILEKVLKERELTPRQIYFRDQDIRRYGWSPKGPAPSKGVLNGNGSGDGSGSETTTGPQYAPAKMVEQGVDEILHLKMLESVVDCEEPSTMVLATGDAAQAEYSDGFMANAERALKKGWKVELISWSKNISSMYTRPAFRQRWGDKFQIIFLDDFAEELLDL